MILKENSFVGQLLVATPHMTDKRFSKSVIYICAHDKYGAMGIVVNKPLENVEFNEVLDQLGIDNTTENNPISVYLGGPVEPNRGFVLHTSDYMHESTLIINNIFAVTSSLDIMKDICKGRGPKHSILAIGYAGWGNGQLDQEILTNGWLIAPADTNLVFETKNNMKWDLSAQNIGINIEKLSGDLGQA
ncbi:MAG: hypothetical protein CMM30_08755 [Rhodospirillaceae bacterium]|nr:hypothetical protein [Rhodospirillaceae bacterium]|tara:strand:- start:1615 stop:2181 length:567 start_codon:yes stop_codon:yes gene_type:complete